MVVTSEPWHERERSKPQMLAARDLEATTYGVQAYHHFLTVSVLLVSVENGRLIDQLHVVSAFALSNRSSAVTRSPS